MNFSLFFFSCFLQVFCVSNFFSQPIEPAVAQGEDPQHSSLQDHSSNGNHYGTADWKKKTLTNCNLAEISILCYGKKRVWNTSELTYELLPVRMHVLNPDWLQASAFSCWFVLLDAAYS